MVYAMAVCLSVTSWTSTKIAKCRITQAVPHNSSGTLVYWRQGLGEITMGLLPVGTKYMG